MDRLDTTRRYVQGVTGVLLVGAIGGVLFVAGSGAAASSGTGSWFDHPEHHGSRTIGADDRRAGARSVRSSGVTGMTRIRQAVEAIEGGRLSEADAALREAMADPSVSETARRMLYRLHDDPRMRLPVDEDGLNEALSRTDQALQRYESDEFVLLTDSGRASARETLALLGRTRDEMYRFTERLGVPAVPHPTKLLAVSFADHDAYRRFAADDGLAAQWAAGYYSSESNRIVLYSETSAPAYLDATREIDEHSVRVAEHRENADRARRDGQHELANLLMHRANSIDEQLTEARRRLNDYVNESKVSKAVHEAAHLLSFNIGLQRPDRVWPFWLSEGLATAFETDHTRRTFGPGVATAAREAELNDLIAAGNTMPYSRLVTLVAAPEADADEAGRMYAQSYGLFTHLVRTDREALAAYITDLGNLTLDPDDPVRTRGALLALFEQHFGPPSRLQRRVERPRRD